MKVNIRRINEWDAPAILKIYSPYAGTVSAQDKEPPSLSEMIQRIDRYTYGYGWLVCEIDGTPAGFCYVTEHHLAPENPFLLDFYVYVKKEYQRRRVGTALFYLLKRILEYGNRHKLYISRTRCDDSAAVFLEHLGFQQKKDSDDAQGRRWEYLLSPENTAAETITKPYLIENKTYEKERETAQNLVRESRSAF